MSKHCRILALILSLTTLFCALPALGDGRLLEQQLKGLTALSGEGKLDIDAIYLADAGLDSDGLAAAERLCRRYPELRFCAAEQDTD